MVLFIRCMPCEKSANAQANAKKTKRAIFSQRIEDKNEELNKK